MADYGKAIGGRLAWALKRKGKPARWLSLELQGREVKGSTWPSVHSYLNGRKVGKKRLWPEPRAEFLIEAAKVLDIGVEWLLSGRGPAEGYVPAAMREIEGRFMQEALRLQAPPTEAAKVAAARRDEFDEALRGLRHEIGGGRIEDGRVYMRPFAAAFEAAANYWFHVSPSRSAQDLAAQVERAFEEAVRLFCVLVGLDAPDRGSTERDALYNDPDFDWFVSSVASAAKVCLTRRDNLPLTA